MGLMSVGQDDSSPSDQAIFLKYLNLAHQELFPITAHINSDLLIAKLVPTVVDENILYLSQPFYMINKVHIQGQYTTLRRLTFDQYLNMSLLNSREAGSPRYFSVHKKGIYLYPAPTDGVYQVAVFYIPLVTLTLDMEEDDIPYPVAYHHVLLNGALTLLFRDESGFRSTSKEQDIKEDWVAGQRNLVSFLSYQSCGSLSTYSDL